MTNDTRYELDYDRWFDLVNAHVQQMIGVSVLDLADYAFRDYYDSDISALVVAREIVQRTMSGDI